MYYVMLVIAAVLFASQFLFNQKFQEECGSSLFAAMLFSLYSAAGGFLILFVLNGCKMSFAPFPFLLSIVCAVDGLLSNYASVKSFESVNLSAYSVFTMLGGMLLPAVFGIAFCGESVTTTKVLCCILIIAATVLTIDFKQKAGKKRYYLAVFVLNGLNGVLAILHQNGPNPVDSFSFLLLGRMVTIILVLLFFIKKPKKSILISKKAMCYSLGFAAFCGIGNLLLLISLKHLPASVQYPIITGGTMAISFFISILRKEKVTRKEGIAAAIAVVSTIVIAL